MSNWRIVGVPLCLLAAGCAKHAPEPSPHPSTPHISWSIGQGTTDKDICKSTEDSSCTLVVPADTPPNRRVADFHLFLHAAPADTKYAGTIQIGFLTQETAQGHIHKVDREVPRGSEPVGFTVSGTVAPPGAYYVDVDLTATPAKAGGPSVPIKTRIAVNVK